MGTRIDTSDITTLLHGIVRSVHGTLEKDLVAHLHEVGPKIVSDMHGAASSKMEKRAARTIVLHKDSKGIEIESTGGTTFPGVIFPGAEYGGQKSRKKIVARGRPLFGKAVPVKRRTTMQFKPWLKAEGYFFWPTVRDWMPKLRDASIDVVEKSMSGRR